MLRVWSIQELYVRMIYAPNMTYLEIPRFAGEHSRGELMSYKYSAAN